MELIIKRVIAMKKILTVLTTAVLVASMAMPAFAVGFVNSVTGSGSPTFVGGGTAGGCLTALVLVPVAESNYPLRLG